MRYTSIAMVILAAWLWGISGAIGNILMDRGWDPFVISFYRGFIGFMVFFVWTFVNVKKSYKPSLRFSAWAMLAGLGVVGNFTFYLLSMQASSISIAVTLMYTAPVFVILTALIFKVEKATWFKWISVVLVFAGIVLLTESYDFDILTASIYATVLGLASGLSYTVFIFGFKNAAALGNAKTTLMFAFFVFSIILYFVMDPYEAFNAITSQDMGWFLLLGLLGAGVSFFIYVIGLRHTPPTTASVVAMVEPVTASLLGIMFLDNELSALQVLGMGIIIVTIPLLSRKQKVSF